MQPLGVIRAIRLVAFLALRLVPISFPWWHLSSAFLSRSVLSLASMKNTNCLCVFLVELGNVACPALRFQFDGSAAGFFLHQYSFMWTLAAKCRSPMLRDCVISYVVTYEEGRWMKTAGVTMTTSHTVV